MSKIVIRRLEEGEIPQMLDSMREMHKEGAFGAQPIAEEKILNMCNKCVTRPDFLCAVAWDGDSIVGFFVAVISADWFSDEATAKELALYVHPDYRGHKLAGSLIGIYLRWAETQNAVTANAGSSSDINNEGVRRLYEGCGFHSVGYNFKKRI